MIKKLITVVLIIALLITAANCSNRDQTNAGPTVPVTSQTVPDSIPASDHEASSDDLMPIFDPDGNLLGQIDSRGNCTAVNSGIFYSITELKEYQFTADAEYRFFDKESRKDILLGKLENQGYEAMFARTEYNGILYTLAVEGDPVTDTSSPLVLLAADPASGTMKKHTVSAYGFPYASMAVSNGKLLIMNHEMSEPKCDKIYTFDPAAETMKDVLTFDSDTDSLRAVCAAEDGFYLLRLKIGNGSENEMFLDRYDDHCSKLSEQSVNETLIKAIQDVRGIMGRQDALNELGLYAGRVAVEDGRYLIYENFGLTRLIIDLQSGEALLTRDDEYSVSFGSGTPYVYRMDFDPDNVEEPDITGIVGGRLEKLSFQPTDSHKCIRSVSHAADGMWLILTSDGFSMQNSTGALYLWTDPDTGS